MTSNSLLKPLLILDLKTLLCEAVKDNGVAIASHKIYMFVGSLFLFFLFFVLYVTLSVTSGILHATNWPSEEARSGKAWVTVCRERRRSFHRKRAVRLSATSQVLLCEGQSCCYISPEVRLPPVAKNKSIAFVFNRSRTCWEI